MKYYRSIVLKYISIGMGVSFQNLSCLNCLSVLSEGRREVVLQFIKFKFGKTSDVEKLFGGPELHLTRNFSTGKSFCKRQKIKFFLSPNIGIRQRQSLIPLEGIIYRASPFVSSNSIWACYRWILFGLYCLVTRKYIETRSLGALRALTSSLGPFGPGLRPSHPSGAQAARPTPVT